MSDPLGELRARIARMYDDLEMAWVVIANVSGGDWTQQSTEWQKAAARWRDRNLIIPSSAGLPTDDTPEE